MWCVYHVSCRHITGPGLFRISLCDFVGLVTENERRTVWHRLAYFNTRAVFIVRQELHVLSGGPVTWNKSYKSEWKSPSASWTTPPSFKTPARCKVFWGSLDYRRVFPVHLILYTLLSSRNVNDNWVTLYIQITDITTAQKNPVTQRPFCLQAQVKSCSEWLVRVIQVKISTHLLYSNVD